MGARRKREGKGSKKHRQAGRRKDEQISERPIFAIRKSLKSSPRQNQPS